ncbi:MAG: cytochrome oxidase subunit III [Bacteroidia bacterium]|nr:cytochrome oxidase subunit III [Bacteroidia bacterium]
MSAEAAGEKPNKSLWDGGISPFQVSWGKMYMWFFLVSDAFTFSSLLIAYATIRHRYAEIWPSADHVFVHFPFVDAHVPLAYVALMTFILIMSSVTMVMAVDAGHRRNNKAVAFWLFWTIIGGFTFLGSQAWEWYHFIHGSAEGALMYEDRTVAQMEGEFTLLLEDGTEVPGNKAGEYFGKEGEHSPIKTIEGDPVVIEMAGFRKRSNGMSTEELISNGYMFEGDAAKKIIMANKIIQGANLEGNQYGKVTFGNFFFFITGFHGFHVFSGVIINIIIYLQVLNGTYVKRGHYEQVEKSGLYWHFVDLVWVFVFTFFYLV